MNINLKKVISDQLEISQDAITKAEDESTGKIEKAIYISITQQGITNVLLALLLEKQNG